MWRVPRINQVRTTERSSLVAAVTVAAVGPALRGRTASLAALVSCACRPPARITASGTPVAGRPARRCDRRRRSRSSASESRAGIRAG
jgi:hypothetical protein